ncbi:MAG: HvfC/BufC N-terminal domain-containing protein [Acidiferrobacterales bacterium]
MPTLPNTLRAMQSSLLDRSEDAEALIADSAFASTDRLQLYRNNLVISLTEALAAIYPVVQRLVGDDFFRVACRDYIPQFPPRQAPLHEFGKDFPGFIRSYKPAGSLAYLADVAVLEWAWHRAYHAADAGKLDATNLQQLPEQHQGELHFTLHPAVQLLKSDYPVDRIWQVNQEGFKGDDKVSLDEGGVCIAVIRPQLEVLVQAIPCAEWEFLTALDKGSTLDQAVEAAGCIDQAFDLATVLQSRVSDNTLVNASID